jgi:tRNA-dependent cyclodipeptide synthase
MAIAGVKSKGGWKNEVRFCLGISVGQNHSGESLSAIVDWINQSSFQHGIIDLSDTLNRYNFMREGVSEQRAMMLARQQGSQWLADNAQTLEKLTKPAEIIRWDSWITNPDFTAMQLRVVNAYQQSLALQHAVLQDIKMFLARKSAPLSSDDYALCRAYLLEEITGHCLLYASSDIAAIYPGKQLESYKAIRAGVVPGLPSGLVESPFVRLVVHSFDQPIMPVQHRVA